MPLNPTSFPSPSNQGFTLLLEARCFVLFDFRVFAYVITHSACPPCYTEHSAPRLPAPRLPVPHTKRFSFSILCGMCTVFYLSSHPKMGLCRGSGLLGVLLQWTGSADISVTCHCHSLWLCTQKWMMDLLGALFLYFQLWTNVTHFPLWLEPLTILATVWGIIVPLTSVSAVALDLSSFSSNIFDFFFLNEPIVLLLAWRRHVIFVLSFLCVVLAILGLTL